MFENIVVATDGSGNAKRAVEVGAKLASVCGAHLTIVHVAPTYLSLADAEGTPELPGEVRDEMKRIHDSLGGAGNERFRSCAGASISNRIYWEFCYRWCREGGP